MTWFKVDDGLAFHPKAVSAGNAAMGLWVRAGSYCAAHLTDGRLPRAMLAPLGGRARDAQKLVLCGLWDATDEGWSFRGWEEFQPTKTQVEQEKRATAERVKAWREQKRNGVTNTVRNTVGNTVGTGAPTRPDPKEEETTSLLSVASAAATKPKSRGTRIPEPFEVTPEMVQWAREEVPGLDHKRVTENFVDWWRGAPGAKGVKVDWPATWRNWLRKEHAATAPDKPRPGTSFWDKPVRRGDD